MSLERGLFDAVRVALLLGLALAAMPLLRGASAATRRLVLVLALGGALVLPVVSALAPAWRVGARPSFVGPSREPFREPLVEGDAVAAAAPRAGATTVMRAATPERAIDPATALVALWALGALVVVARLAVGMLRARALVRGANAAPSWARAVARAERATGIRADVRATDELDAPAVTGVLAPVVLVPRAGEAWSEERRVAVLLHELAHVRRRDCLAQIVGQLACALHWFNPLAWIAASRLRLERELAADDAVIAAGARPSRYAADLLEIAGLRVAPASALGMAERSQLAARVTAIVASGRARAPLSSPRAALLVAVAATLLFVVACATPEAPVRPPVAPTTSAAPASAVSAAPPSSTSTIDPRIQKIADEELDRAVAEWQAAAGVVVVLEPATGAILASAGRAGGQITDVAAGRVYVTGSTLKAITLAAALDEGVVKATESFECGNGSRAYGSLTLRDAGSYGLLTVPEMLAVSTNVGFSRIFDRLGGDRYGRWLRRFHFGEAPRVVGAVAGELPARIEDGSFEGAAVAIGEGQMTASPLQMAAAYAALANGGVYMAPTMSSRERARGEAIVRPETAQTVMGMLEGVVSGERATTGKLARIAGVRVAGKTGTADYSADGSSIIYASFVGIVPADHPRFVVLVGVQAPRGRESGGKVAAPVFARIASRALGG
jgi:beta-lactamase regulating signal transducer with metallopeptidase domain